VASSFLKILGAVAGVLITGVAVFAFVDVGAAEAPADTVPMAAESSTSSPWATSSTTSTTATSSTTSTSTPTTTTLPPRGTLVIHGTGDVNLDPGYIPALGDNGYAYAWEALDGLFEGDDLTVVNLECAPSDLGTPEPKEFVFRCPTESLPSLASAGVEVAGMGNNHTGDYGKQALVDGRGQLIAAGLQPVGAGVDVTEAGQPAVFEIDGWTVAVVGFGGVVPNPAWLATRDRPGMRTGDDTSSMVEAVTAADELADIVVVTIHWGVELDTEPRAEDVDRARAMIGAGADVIFGHHAHRLQPFEMVDDAAVFWGLGNFVWPRHSTAGSTTAVARAIVHPDGSIEGCLIPAFIENHGQPVVTDEPECGPGR
jgi:poly-gamma-glutamate capsule biosynthesis protein CapA/YwtB (metallophosphatase superfamily)